MAYTKREIDNLLRRVVDKLDISDALFNDAKSEYNNLGKWIATQTDYDISIYPQGSFSLGTVIRPISDEDDYDLDLVCELAESYGLEAEELKCEVVKNWLVDYKRISGEIEEKRRCWHVEYEEIPNFHMDVIPAYKVDEAVSSVSGMIDITEHDEENDLYKYIGSNPSGYTEWFFGRCEKRLTAIMEAYNFQIREEVEIEPLERNRAKTPLQQAVQLLKRHRDVMFDSYPDEEEANGEISKADKPISILITTIAAQLYVNEDSTIETLNYILTNAERYIESHKKNEKYYIENPSFAGENFADKWNYTENRRQAFFDWLRKAKKDLNMDYLLSMNRVELLKHIKSLFGEELTTRVINEMAQEDREGIETGELLMESSTGILSENGDVEIRTNHHHSG